MAEETSYNVRQRVVVNTTVRVKAKTEEEAAKNAEDWTSKLLLNWDSDETVISDMETVITDIEATDIYESDEQ